MSTDPVVKTIHVALSPQAAFDLFTKRIGDWWPVETFSVSAGQGKPSQSVTLAGGIGSEIVEIAADGSRHVWGTVRDWAPGKSFVTTWHPGREASFATKLLVAFASEGDGTRVTLTHSNWDVLGEEAVSSREGYDGGWVVVLGQFEAAV